jgi:hypothetical protein
MAINIPKIENPKEFFLLNDSLNNVTFDIDFSVTKKYRCRAKCSMCYIQNDWVSDDHFYKYVPNSPPVGEHLDKLLFLFDHFDVVSTIDDLRYLKDHHDNLFNFYREHGFRFSISSMTDNAIFRHVDIIDSEIRAKDITEISISERFLSKIQLPRLIQALDRIQKNVPIQKIKIIIMPEFDNSQKVKELSEWTNLNGILLQKHLEFVAGIENMLTEKDQNLLDFEDAKKHESTVYTEDFGEIYPVHSEVLFLMYDSFYSELKSATSEKRSASFASIHDFEPISFLSKVLNGKIRDYTRYTNQIQNRQNPYYRYFQYVVDHVRINENFNFVPFMLLNTKSKYYRQLVDAGTMIETGKGLLKKNLSDNEKVIPLVEISSS